MIALQDRIRQLESENVRMSEELKDNIEELGKYKKVVEKLKLELEKYKNELNHENEHLINQVKILDNKVRQLVAEKDKHLEQNAIDKSKWRAKEEKLIEELKTSEMERKELVKRKEVMINEVNELKQSLSNIRDQYQTSHIEAEQEINRLKKELNKSINDEVLELKAKLKTISDELERTKQRYRMTKMLNKNNIMSFKKTIDLQKKEIETLKNSQCKYTLPSYSRSPLKKHSHCQSSVFKNVTVQERHNTSETFNQRMNENKKNVLLTPKNNHKVLNRPSLIRAKSKENNSFDNMYSEKEVLDKIFLLEREIADLSYQHKKLLAKTQDSVTRVKSLKSLSKELEGKKESLIRLRKQQLRKQA